MKSGFSKLVCLTAGGLLVAATANAQLNETFDDRSNITSITTAGGTNDFFSDGAGDFFGIIDEAGATDDFGAGTEPSGGTFTNVTGNYLIAQDTDGDVPGDTSVTLTYNVNISGMADPQFAVSLAEDTAGDSAEDWDADASVIFTVTIDAGTPETLLAVEATGGTNTAPGIDTTGDGLADGAPITDEFTQFVADITGTGTTAVLTVVINRLDAGDEDIAIDNIIIQDGGLIVAPTGVTVDGTLDVSEGYITIDEVDPTLKEGFGGAIDASGLYYVRDGGNHNFFVRGKLDTGSNNGMTTFVDFQSFSGVAAGDSLTTPGGPSVFGSGQDIVADVEFDFGFNANPGNNTTNTFVDGIRFDSFAGDFAGVGVDQAGTPGTFAGALNGITVAFNNGGGLDQGFEFSIPESLVGSTGIDNDIIKIFSAINSDSNYFSNDTIPVVPTNSGNLGTDGAGNFVGGGGINFFTDVPGVQARAIENDGDLLPRVQNVYAYNGQLYADYSADPLFNLAFGSDFDVFINGTQTTVSNPVIDPSNATGGIVDSASLPSTNDGTADVFGDFFYATDIEFYAYPSIALLQDNENSGIYSDGQVLSLFGTVSAIQDSNGRFAIASAPGAFNGIVIDNDAATTAGIVLGQNLEIVADMSGSDFIELDNFGGLVNDLGPGTPITPLVVNAADFASTNTTGTLPAEQYEGVLITINGLTNPFNPDSPSDFGERSFDQNVRVDDFFFATSEATIDGATPGSTFDITGIGNFSFGTYKVLPSGVSDIAITPGSSESDWLLLDN